MLKLMKCTVDMQLLVSSFCFCWLIVVSRYISREHGHEKAPTHTHQATSHRLLVHGTCKQRGCRRTGLASLGGARGLLGGLKGMSGLGGSVRIGHQHSCCSLARLSAVTAVSLASSSLPADQQ